MGRPRRRRARYTWLPTLGTAGPEGSDDNSSGREFTLLVPEDGSSDVIITPLTFDEPKEGDDLNLASNPLGTILGNEYFIKRIVGKLFASHRQQTNAGGDPSLPGAALFGAGFFIARANDTSQGPDQPIGSASIVERQENYSPLSEDTIREPWIWRRTWVLQNYFQRGASALGRATFDPALAANATEFQGVYVPTSTMEYGSVLDGPHIDAKTARRVKQDERLFFVVASRALPTASVFNTNGLIDGYLDFRILGALRKARQGSAF